MSRIVVAIDGPAASGKSTTARRVAERLGYCHLNSGQLYRTIGWLALRDGSIEHSDRLASDLSRLEIDLLREPPTYEIRVNGEFPGPVLSAPQVARSASRVATFAEVRGRVLELLRAEGVRSGLTCDGRDIGTVVFPDAQLKIFLDADETERARRRLTELGIEVRADDLAGEVARIRERDARDAGRALAPLSRAEDAIAIDTTTLSPEEVVDRIVGLAVERGATA